MSEKKGTPDQPLARFAAAILTGGSSGIGQAFLKRLEMVGEKGVVCNLSRTAPDTDFEGLHHVPCDLSDRKQVIKAAEEVLSMVEKVRPVGPVLLINNSGFGSYGHFPAPDLEHNLGMIEVNVTGLVQLTGLLLPALTERGGTIMNIASIAGLQPTPFMGTYGASKAFVVSWSLALREELKDRGVRVMCICPGPTESQFFERAGLEKGAVSARLGQRADEVAGLALRKLRTAPGLIVCGWSRKVLMAVVRIIPLRWQAPLVAVVLRRMRLERMKRA